MTTRWLALLLVACTCASAQDVDGPSPPGVEHVVRDQVQVNDSVRRSLDDVMSHVRSDQWRQKQSRLLDEVARAIGIDTIPDQNASSNNTADQDRLVVFVSSSMPLTTLRNYARSLDGVNGLLVLRGMVGGMRTVGPTLSLIGRMLSVDPNCEGHGCAMRSTSVVIDPELFRDHNIDKVPAAVFVKDMPLAPYCERLDEDSRPSRHTDVVYGDVSVRAMAAELYRSSGERRLQRWMEGL